MSRKTRRQELRGEYALYCYFHWFNEEFFKGWIPEPAFDVFRMRGHRVGSFLPYGANRALPDGLIQIDYHTLHHTRQWKGVLLHEMIHAWNRLRGIDEDEYDGHGPAFAEECNRIGKRLRLPTVTEEECYGWPFCVFTTEYRDKEDD